MQNVRILPEHSLPCDEVASIHSRANGHLKASLFRICRGYLCQPIIEPQSKSRRPSNHSPHPFRTRPEAVCQTASVTPNRGSRGVALGPGSWVLLGILFGEKTRATKGFYMPFMLLAWGRG